jgi:hypothetical protein
MVVVSFFFMSLFVGIMLEKFNLAWSKEKTKGFVNNTTALRYYELLTQIYNTEPEFNVIKLDEKHPIVRRAYSLVSTSYFENGILVVIILNVFVMAMSYEGARPLYQEILDKLNLTFTVIFIAEAILKLIGQGVKGYFYYTWNRFDFFVVSCSIVDISITYSSLTNSSFLKSFQIIRILRLLRISRLFKLIKSMKGLEKLIKMLRYSITALGNIFILMFLVLCIFSVMGCYLYDDIRFVDYKSKFGVINENYNFDDFYHAFLTCFLLLTGEGWSLMMMEMAYGKIIRLTSLVDQKKVSSSVARVYFMLANFIMCVIMVNLFILITIQQYNEFAGGNENPIDQFNEILTDFRNAWHKYSNSSDKGVRIRLSNLVLMLNDLRSEVAKDTDFTRKILLDLRVLNYQGYVYFHDVLFKLIKRRYGRGKPNKLIQDEERKLIKSIVERIKLNVSKSRDNLVNVQRKKISTFNPVKEYLYFKVNYIYLKKVLSKQILFYCLRHV